MANHDMIVEQNQNLSLRHIQSLGLGHNHHFVLSHSHDLGLDHNDDHDSDLGHVRDLGRGLGQAHMNGLDVNEHDGMALEQIHVCDIEDTGLDEEIDADANKKQANDNGGLVVQNDESEFHANQELAILENVGMHENLDLDVDQNQEMGIVPYLDMSVHESQLLMTPPVLQSRSLVHVPNHELTVGQEFPDVQSCRRALRDAAIALRFEIQTIKSDKTRFTAKCATVGCPWRIHAAKLPGVPTFTIRTIHEAHTCGGITHLGHQQASVQWVADTVEQRLRENPHYKPKEILEEIHRVHGIALTYKQAWRGKERIMATVRGSFEEEYRQLPQYCDQIRSTNPGSIASVYVNPADNCFQRLFISYQASIYGFLNGCRPLIGLDRTVLKSKYLGTLLFATAFDGDSALFPLAFGVVDEENEDNWLWFLFELHSLLENNVENMPKLTILSDRNKGIVEGVQTTFPTAFHGFCMRHLSDSFQKEFNCTILYNLLLEAAHVQTVREFDQKIHEIEEISPEAAYWIRQVPARLWATACFEGTRYGHLTANIVESLNPWIHEASGLPIIQMMEYIRRKLMTWFNERREMSMHWASILVPSAENHISNALACAHSYQVLRANEAEFQVILCDGQYTVDIRSRCCDCRGWQLCGLPCAHAVAALRSCRQNVHRFTENCFTVANYRKAYSQTIHPIPDKTMWREMSDEFQIEGVKDVQIIINPPKSLRPPGRPRKRRIRSEDRGRAKRIVHCSRCNQTGHFRTTCGAPI